MGSGMSKRDPRLGTHHLDKPITPSERTWLARQFAVDGTGSFLMGPGFLPVQDLPRFVEEIRILEEGRMFSLRGRDEALFRAYYNKFLDTWGAYVYEVHGAPSQAANGEWSVLLITSEYNFAIMTGRPMPTQEAEEQHDDDLGDNQKI